MYKDWASNYVLYLKDEHVILMKTVNFLKVFDTIN